MSFLKAMKEKKKELLTVSHPLASADEYLKSAYATGVALLMARADENLLDAEREALGSLIYALGLPAEKTDEIISTVQNTGPEIVDVIVKALANEDHKMLFLLDLYRGASADKDFSDSEKEMIGEFVEMLKMEKMRDFVASFSAATDSGDCEKANKLVQAVIEKGQEPNIGHLQYFMPEFKYEETIEGFELGPGQVRTINRPSVLTGKIIVRAGGQLSIKGARIKFSGEETQIEICAGKFELEDSIIEATATSRETLIEACRDVIAIKIINCQFDGASKVDFISSSATTTDIINCTFKNSFGRALMLNKIATVTNCKFENCEQAYKTPYLQDFGGSAILGGSELITIENTTFIDCKSMFNGGALAICNAKITGCTFVDCSSSRKGGAIGTSSIFGSMFDDGYEFINCVFENCSASSGGAIHGDSFSGSDSCTFKNCRPDKWAKG